MTQFEIFPETHRRVPSPPPIDRELRDEFGQYATPAWAAEVLFDAHFSHLTPKDLLWEPTCGYGNMLSAVPSEIPAIGSEIDAALGRQAMIRTGRRVIIGDCRTAPLPSGISAVFGNPPFTLEVFEGLLERCASILKNGQKAGFILPAYFVQTSRTMMPWTRTWTIMQEALPRDLFVGLSKPLIFGLFTKDHSPRLIGFRLFPEVAACRELPEETQDQFANAVNGPRSVWRETVIAVMQSLGGQASLSAIYRELEGNRPTANAHWKEQIRKVLGNTEHFARLDDGVYTLANAA